VALRSANRVEALVSTPEIVFRLTVNCRVDRVRQAIDNYFCQCYRRTMNELAVIDDAATAITALEPARNRLLALLEEPASAAMLASRLAIPRQKVNYHLRALESHGLVEAAETRRWGGLTERLFVASANSYVVSPAALGAVAADPAKSHDRLSARYLIALAARVVREVGSMVRQADAANLKLPSLSIDTIIRFRSPGDRAAFTQELTESINWITARYHDASAPGGRAHRLVLFAHPLPAEEQRKETS
jgi:DNA-binding transcriptional ArsR family regulator